MFVKVSVVAFATNVSVADGKVKVTSADVAGPINVTLFVPLFVPSKNSSLPAVVAVATGSDGQVLTSTGAGSPPAFEALPASGISTGKAIAMAIVFG